MSRERIAALSIFAAALALRLSYLWCQVDSPLFDSPAMDAQLHTFWAWSIVESGGMGPEPFFRAPLYPHFMALFVQWLGQSFESFLAIRAAQFVLGAMSCVLLYDLARRIHGFRVGVLAGGMAALYWVFIYFEGELLLPALINFLNLAAFSCLYRAVTRTRHNGWWYLAAGLLLGLSAITRPNILVFAPFLFVWLVVLYRRDRRPGVGVALAGVATGLLLPVGCVTMRNYVVGGDFVVIASQAGVNFYIGNNEFSDGRTAVVPGTRATWLGGYEDTIRIAERAQGRRLRASEVSRYWFGRGLEFLREHPGAGVMLYLRKFGLLLNPLEDSNNQNIYFFANRSVILGMPIFLSFWMLVPFGIGGILSNARNRWWWLFAGFVVVYLASFLPFFVTARYRVPAIPFLIILAAVFIVRLRELWRARQNRKLARRGVLVLGLAILLGLNSGVVAGADVDAPSDGHFTLGNAWVRKNEFDAALRHFILSARFHEPYSSRSKMQIGTIQLMRGDLGAAHASLRDALRANPRLEDEIANVCFDHGRAGTVEAVLSPAQIDRARRRRQQRR